MDQLPSNKLEDDLILHVFATFDQAALGGGATRIGDLHSTALGPLSIGPPCVCVTNRGESCCMLSVTKELKNTSDPSR